MDINSSNKKRLNSLRKSHSNILDQKCKKFTAHTSVAMVSKDPTKILLLSELYVYVLRKNKSSVFKMDKDSLGESLLNERFDCYAKPVRKTFGTVKVPAF